MRIFFAVLLSLLTFSALSQNLFDTGNKLRRECEGSNYSEGYCLGYIIGVSDANAAYLCIPDGVTKGQMFSIVKKFLRENPEQLHKDADFIVTSALIRAFPCKGKK